MRLGQRAEYKSCARYIGTTQAGIQVSKWQIALSVRNAAQVRTYRSGDNSFVLIYDYDINLFFIYPLSN